MDVGKELKASVHKNLNVPAFVSDVIDKVAEPALKAAVEKSETKLDDLLVAAILPLLKVELKKATQEQWEKLFVENSLGEPV